MVSAILGDEQGGARTLGNRRKPRLRVGNEIRVHDLERKPRRRERLHLRRSVRDDRHPPGLHLVRYDVEIERHERGERRGIGREHAHLGAHVLRPDRDSEEEKGQSDSPCGVHGAGL